MKVGYYFVDSLYGTFNQGVKGYTDFTFCEAQTRGVWWYHNSEVEFVEALRRADRQGLSIHLNFQDSEPARVVALAAPFWNSVELVDVRDEPDYKRRQMDAAVDDLNEAIVAAGLRSKPIGAVFTNAMVMHGNGWSAPGMDWIGVECYVASSYQNDPKAIKAEVDKILGEQFEQLPNKPIVVVGQAFARRTPEQPKGAWTNKATLADLQDWTYQVAKRDSRVTHLRWFNYGREDGTRYIQPVKQRHKAIAASEGAATG